MSRTLKIPFLILCFLILIVFHGRAQKSKADTASFVPLVTVNGGFYMPGGDLADRFGSSFNVGLSANFKLKNQWIFGVDYNFQFGGVVREDTILNGLINSDGYIIADNGIPAIVGLLNRGHMIMANAGRLFPVIGPNENSGVMVKLGLGYYQHKIRIETSSDNIPQLSKELKTYYDRLTGGFLVNTYVGYSRVSRVKRANFQIGLDFNMGFTNTLRSYDMPSGSKLDNPRIDISTGIRVGWIIPIYSRTTEQYYR